MFFRREVEVPEATERGAARKSTARHLDVAAGVTCAAKPTRMCNDSPRCDSPRRGCRFLPAPDPLVDPKPPLRPLPEEPRRPTTYRPPSQPLATQFVLHLLGSSAPRCLREAGRDREHDGAADDQELALGEAVELTAVASSRNGTIRALGRPGGQGGGRQRT